MSIGHKVSGTFLILSGLVASLVILEIVLRTAHILLPQPRASPLPDYGDTIGIDIRKAAPGKGGFLKSDFKGYVRGPSGESKEWITNRQGYRYRYDIADVPEPGLLRIVSLGDSFAAGYRMGQDETYSSIIEDELAAQGIRAEVPIAQIEEPTSALYYFQEYGSKLSPDMVILGVTLGNDISQTLYYLGNKYSISETGRISLLKHEFSDYWRKEFLSYDIPPECITGRGESPVVTPANIEHHFHSPSVVIKSTYMNLKKSRFVEQPYPIASYLGAYGSNLLDASNGLGHYLVNPPQVISDSYNKFFRVLAALNMQAIENHTTLVVVLFPQRFQTQSGDWDATVRAYGLKPDCFDLMKPNKKIKQFCTSVSMICIDVTLALRTQYEQKHKSQFLPWGDMHMNQNGHRTVGKDIAKSLVTIMSESTVLQGRDGNTTR